MTESGKSSDPEKVLQISKYPNRRFYDKTRSRHLTLEDLYAAIRDGYEIHVMDSKTGQDITTKTLAHIILELDPPKLDVFPVALLHRLLRANEQLVLDFTEKYFSQAFMAFLDSQKKAEQYLRQAMALQPGPALVTDWAKMMLGPFSPAAWASRPGEATVQKAPPPPTPQEPPAPMARTRQALVRLQKKKAQKPRGKSRSNLNPSRR